MKLILEIHGHSNDEHVAHHIVARFPVTIGRGFHNDIILSDPHVSAHHLKIDQEGVGFLVSDLGSENGLVVKGRHLHKKSLHVPSGTVLHIGQTEIRLYTPEHPVTATVKLQKTSPLFPWLSRSLSMWISFALALSLTTLKCYMDDWEDKVGQAMTIVSAITVGSILIWAALWSVAGRLIQHRSRFKIHVSMICIYVTVSLLIWQLETYIDFLANDNWFSQAVTFVLDIIPLAFLLYGSLTITTLMTQSRRLMSAGLIAFFIVMGGFLASLVSASNFSPQANYPATLKPYLSQLAPTVTIDQFTAENSGLFASNDPLKHGKGD